MTGTLVDDSTQRTDATPAVTPNAGAHEGTTGLFRAILNAHAAIPDIIARASHPCTYHLWIDTADGAVCVECGATRK